MERSRAAGIHLGISLAIATVAALLVFVEWYPYPYREISGGRELFLILVTVDVIMGPLITLMIFDTAKPRRELRLDLAVVGLLQLAALAYGMWTVSLARPVHLVFEMDRFRVVHAAEIPVDALDRVPPGVDAMPWLGPTMLAVRPFRSEAERMETTLLALQGVSHSAQPGLWEPYEAALPRVRAAAKPVAELRSRFPREAAAIDAAIADTGVPASGLVYLPMHGRKTFWTAFVEPVSGRVVGFMPLDSF